VAPLLRASLNTLFVLLFFELTSTDYFLCYRIFGVQE
jgi:hypothetical protein